MCRLDLRVGLLLGIVLSAPAALAQEPARGSLSPGRTFAEQSGAALYANVCAACHQANGEGAVGAAAYPSLAANPNLAAGGYVVTVMLDGLRGMPPVGRMMSDRQVAEVVNYVRSHFGNRYLDAVAPGDVKAARPPAGAAP